MSDKPFAALYQGPRALYGRHFQDYKPAAIPGVELSFHQFTCYGLYAIDAEGRPWAHVVDEQAKYDGATDPDRIFKWVPLP